MRQIDQKTENDVVLPDKLCLLLGVNFYFGKINSVNRQSQYKNADQSDTLHRLKLKHEIRKNARQQSQPVKQQNSGALGKPERDQPVRCVVASALRSLASPNFSQDGNKSRIENRHEKNQNRHG